MFSVFSYVRCRLFLFIQSHFPRSILVDVQVAMGINPLPQQIKAKVGSMSMVDNTADGTS